MNTQFPLVRGLSQFPFSWVRICLLDIRGTAIYRKVCFSYRSILLKIMITGLSKAFSSCKVRFTIFYLVFILRMGNITYMQQDIASLTSSRVDLKLSTRWWGNLRIKPTVSLSRKGSLIKYHLTGGGVERGKQLILCKYLAFTQRVHDRAFTYVGITYQRLHGYILRVLYAG